MELLEERGGWVARFVEKETRGRWRGEGKILASEMVSKSRSLRGDMGGGGGVGGGEGSVGGGGPGIG